MDYLEEKVTYDDEGFEKLKDACDFLPEEQREEGIITLLFSIGWF